MDIKKSSRHSKITGDFAERLVLYWLSKNGFECAYVDHVGIDIIAKNRHINELMGISVKCRSRYDGTEGFSLSIPNGNIDKIDFACKAFGCEPYFAIVIDGAAKIYLFIISKKHLLKLFPKKKTNIDWKMSKMYLEQYKKDKNIQMIEIDYKELNWWVS